MRSANSVTSIRTEWLFCCCLRCVCIHTTLKYLPLSLVQNTSITTLTSLVRVWQDVQVLTVVVGVAQLVVCRAQDPKDRGSNPVRSTRKICEIFRVKNVVLTRLSVCPTPVCIRTHKIDHVHTLKILWSLSLSVLWITETRKDPACTLLTVG